MELQIMNQYEQWQERIIKQNLEDLNRLVSMEVLQGIVRSLPIKELILYGSRAKGGWFDSSDIDLILVGEGSDPAALLEKVKDSIYSSLSHHVPLDITSYDFSLSTVSHITYGEPELFEEKVSTYPLEEEKWDSRFFQTECFVFNGETILYRNQIFSKE